ncbi:MAG: penicillin-binding protein 2 [Candidatus Pacebacteria bacterium]|nr:penicillin-binding protein 2 [Candidatus Paceibacterota bacterium]
MKKKFSSLGNKNDFVFRVYMLIGLVVIVFCVILFRLFQIQIIKHDFYKALAENQHEFFQKTVPRRGEIFIKDLYSEKLCPLAVNKELNIVYAIPKNIENKKEVSGRLSGILDIESEKIFNIINKKDDPYEVIKNKVTNDVAEKVRNENIIGIDIAPEIVRYYPSNYLASNIVGFLGYSGNEKTGQYGIEGYYNDRLKGAMGFLEIEKDASGNWISFGLKSSQAPKDGDDIVLTIDQTIQYISEKKIREAVEKYGAQRGDLIVMDPITGAVIALAQYPNYNPNEYFKEEDMGVFLSSGVHSVYEPGSVQKPITLAIGIDLGKIGPNTTYEDKGSLKIDGWPISNSDGKVNGKQTMIQVLEKSLNTGTVFAANQVNKNDFYKYLKNFGLNELTGIEIVGETKGSLSNLKNKTDISYATASYGQGISVTPLAMLNAISSFANGGKLMKPHIVSEFVNVDGISEKVEPQIIRRVVSARTANLVSAMMVSVIKNGHAQQAKVEGYDFAGKTGTAQIPKKEGRGYEEDKTIHTFVGFGPMPNPKFSILVKLDEPQNASYAADTTAHIFRELSQELVNYYNIPPTE